MDAYDAVVVGAGLGGLSAGACLAKAGKKVLVVERQDGVGGNAHAFRRGEYTFDPAIHVTAHGFNIEFLDFYLAALGIGDLELITAEENSGVDIAGSRFTLPTGVEALTEYLCGQFPGDAEGVAAFVQVCAEATRESQAPPPRVAPKDLGELMAALPTLFKYRTATVSDVLDEFLTDPQAKAVCGAQWPYLGLPPSRQSFMSYSGAWMAMVEPGPIYPRGGFQALSDALAETITQNGGGKVLLETTVTAISVEDGRATGVVLQGGEEVRAPIVVSNADARLTYEELVGTEHLPDRLVRRLGRMKPSLSAFLLYSATTLDPRDFGIAHETFVYNHWDHDETYRELQDGGLGGMWFSVPTQHDSGLAPDGEHIVIFTSLMPYDIGEPWDAAKPRYTEMMIDQVEERMPGFRESTTFLDSATPATFQSYTLANQGAAYGWENTPNQTVPKRLDHKTPVDGLWLAGHWTHPGTGSVRCLLSGAQAAAGIMDLHDPIELLGSLHASQA